jgi:hypothetical protein
MKRASSSSHPVSPSPGTKNSGPLFEQFRKFKSDFVASSSARLRLTDAMERGPVRRKEFLLRAAGWPLCCFIGELLAKRIDN